MKNGQLEKQTMSTTRPLIVGGCSFSYSDLRIYKEHGIFAWPRIVAEELDMELIELSQPGASNPYIENVLTDAILEYKDKNPVVIAYWSVPNRINCFDFYPDKCDENTKIFNPWGNEPEYLPYYCVVNSLRCIWRTKTFAKQHGIEFYHDLSGCWAVPYNLTYANSTSSTRKESWLAIRSKIRKNWYFRNLEFSMKLIEEGAIFSEIPDDGHPDQAAHEKIAEEFIHKYNHD